MPNESEKLASAGAPPARASAAVRPATMATRERRELIFIWIVGCAKNTAPREKLQPRGKVSGPDRRCHLMDD